MRKPAGAALAPRVNAESLDAQGSLERDDRDFSLVLGGPTFQALRRVRLSNDQLGLLHRRLLASVLLMWAPLAVLSALEGGLVGPGRALPFLKDIGFQLRFLIVAPLLIGAELLVHRRLRLLVCEFRERKLVPASQQARFVAALNNVRRLRNSVVAELGLLAFVYLGGIPITLARYTTFGWDAWYASPGGGVEISAAGMWLVLVSLPLFQFLLLRWYYRLLIWGWFLWQVSRIDLDLEASHPDKSGGLGFLGESLVAFAPIAAAHGLLFAGMLADRIFYGGAELMDFQVEVFAAAVLLLAIFAGPLTVFAPRLGWVKRVGLRKYGALGQDYVRGFNAKWMAGATPADEPLVGSGDIQSLADLGNSYGSAEQMRFVPVRTTQLLAFVAAFILPITPLLLTIMSPEKLLDQVIGMVF